MQLQIRYVSSFRYDTPVRESHNQLRACPVETPTQKLISFAIHTDPAARVHTFVDYWGTRVDAFGIRKPHDELTVAATSVVETAPPPTPGAFPAPFEVYASPEVRLDYTELLGDSRHTQRGEHLVRTAHAAVDGAGTAVEAVIALQRTLTGDLRYEPGSTFVGVDVNTVLSQGAGVCQDFAHLLITGCRSVGVPARYVSGYLYETLENDVEVDVQTHAWVEVLVPGWGWWGLDPTNRGGVGQRHVKIGHGRDYDDVPPLRGVFHGDATHELGVSVRISREELSALASQQ